MPRLSPRYVFLGLGGLALVLVLLLPQLHSLIPAFRATLSDTERLTLDLIQIGLIALILAALLSPLESLGNCAQDSNQALYAALQRGSRARVWTQVNPDAAPQIKQLMRLGRSLKRDLLPWGTARADWKGHETVLGSSLEDDPLKQLWMGLVSWRTVLPRVASDAVVQSFLQQGATVLVLRTSQVGGPNPDIDSIAPLSL